MRFMGSAASDLGSQIIIRVIPALRCTKRKSGHASRCESPAELAWGQRRLRMHDLVVESLTAPPEGVNLIAFARRLSTIC